MDDLIAERDTVLLAKPTLAVTRELPGIPPTIRRAAKDGAVFAGTTQQVLRFKSPSTKKITLKIPPG